MHRDLARRGGAAAAVGLPGAAAHLTAVGLPRVHPGLEAPSLRGRPLPVLSRPDWTKAVIPQLPGLNWLKGLCSGEKPQ
jgi:hypothetical protein